MQILEREHDRLRARGCRNPDVERRHLPAAQLLRGERRSTLSRQRDVEQRREQLRIFRGVELHLGERCFEVREAALRGDVSAAETLPVPIGDRMQRCILQ
jgi:hypothetical protein